ncbi:MAG: sensor domain-containing diguanylate cyclase [Chloroflexi bacterium]|nr:sensor domain-containing diguanylate cyclase [Chloroflexota bacterium]
MNAAADVQLSGEAFREVLEHLDVGVFIVDAERRIQYWNKGAEKLTGYKTAEMIGISCRVDLRMHVDLAGNSMCEDNCPLQAAMDTGRPIQREVFMRSADGHRLMVNLKAVALHDEHGRPNGALQIFSDLSLRQDYLQRLSQLKNVADADSLTGLRNRRYLELVLERGLQELKRYQQPFGVIFIDVDDLKAINTRGGHSAGDAALRHVGYVLNSKIRRDDVVARWGGDEFLVFLDGITPVRLAEIGHALVAGVAAVSALSGREVQAVTISAGATMGREDDDVETLLRRADAAQFHSKQAGKNRFTMTE